MCVCVCVCVCVFSIGLSEMVEAQQICEKSSIVVIKGRFVLKISTTAISELYINSKLD